MTICDELVARVEACKAGRDDWQAFASASLDVLRYLFVPPLKDPHVEYDTATLSGTDRRDAIFSNRMLDPEASSWGYLRLELNAKLVVVDFKNYAPDKDAVLHTLDYLRPEMGRLAIICCREPAKQSALIKRNEKFQADSKPVVLFLTPVHMREMCARKARGEDPADVLVDLLEAFYMQRE